MRSPIRVFLVLFLALCCIQDMARAQFPAPCDANKACVGNALTITQTSGRTAQYVDVDNSATIRALSTAMTFEAWIKPQAQPGMRQFIGGVWGPNRDNNDQWVLYIENETITFALSHDQQFRGDVDNTVVTFTVNGLYTKGWTHVSAVFDGSAQLATLYIDGNPVATGTNAQYPLSRLHAIENPVKLPMQIGSCNALTDDSLRYRTFKGQMDEIRLWNRVLTAQEIQCQRLLSLNGNEAGLIAYYRCNESTTAQDLCDATGNGNTGKMRSGAHCDVNDRVIPLSYTVQPTSVTAALFCTSDTTMTFTIVDTTFCGSRVNIGIGGRDAALFTASIGSLTLVKDVPQTFTVRLRAQITGPITAELQIVNSNRCGATLRIPLTFTRTTELEYSKTSIKFDTVYVGCLSRTYDEDTIRICNKASRPINLDSIVMNRKIMTWRPDAGSGSVPLPTVLQPGQCWYVIVRYNVSDTTRTERDTMHVYSNEACLGSGLVPMDGRSQDVFILLNATASRRIDSMKFEAVCPGQISNTQDYQYRNLVSETIYIDTIFFSNGFFGRRISFPLRLLPNTAYQNEFVRFRPDRPGPFAGQMIARVTYRGCTIEKRIQLTGRGIDVNIKFVSPVNGVDFGNVTIGKASQQLIPVRNDGQDLRNLSIYLKVGDVFRIVSGRSMSLAPGQMNNVNVEFRPREAKTYYDTLCVFDFECFGTFCVPIQGTGVFQSLSFEPPFIAIDNIVGCRCQEDSVKVTNILSQPLTIQSVTLSDPSGKYTLLTNPSGTLAPGQSYTYKARYCPNDLTDDRSDRAYIQLRLSDGQQYDILLRGNSVVPRLLVTDLTTFGTVEVGWQKTLMILVENSSAVPINVSSMTLPPGYTALSYQRGTPLVPVTLPQMLQPRDSIWVEVQFKPTAETNYNGPLTVSADAPCVSSYNGQITGKGVIVRLDVATQFINFGFVKPCDCPVREIPLPNNSQFIPITIDSVWYDGVGVPNPNPNVFQWRFSGPNPTTLPHIVQPQTFDTLYTSYCPNVPATPANALSNAVLHIKAKTPGWSQEFRTTTSGRREINFQPSVQIVAFPTTVVDVNAPQRTFNLSVPDPFTNPSGDSIIITGLTLVPDQGVFTVTAANGQPFPWIIKRNQTFNINVNFKPRAPRAYSARLNILTSFPCVGADTTVLITGSGNANAFGLQFAFDTANIRRDTFRISTCDTLVLPIQTTRDIPQSILDMFYKLTYDTTALQFIDITSPYTSTINVTDTLGGKKISMYDARNVPAGTFATVRFVARGIPTAFRLGLDGIAPTDEIETSSDSLLLFKFVVAKDEGYVIISLPQITITKQTNFDTVNVKFCKDLDVVVRNTGVLPVQFDSLPIPRAHSIVSTSVPYPRVLQPNDSIVFTLRFCPREEGLIDTLLQAYAKAPCVISDIGSIYSYGYAPPFPMRLGLDANFSTIDTLRGAIADTVEMKIFTDRDIVQTPLDINFALDYNLRSLQYLRMSSLYSSGATATPTASGLRVALPKCQNVVKGEIAHLWFVMTVPDTVLTTMHLAPLKFTSDSIFWVKPVVAGDSSMVSVGPKCNVSRMVFRGNLLNKLSPPVPNPAQGSFRMDVQFIEDAKPSLRLYDVHGKEVASLIDGSTVMQGGSYRIDYDARMIPSGVYMCVFEAGLFRATQQLVITK